MVLVAVLGWESNCARPNCARMWEVGVRVVEASVLASICLGVVGGRDAGASGCVCGGFGLAYCTAHAEGVGGGGWHGGCCTCLVLNLHG